MSDELQFPVERNRPPQLIDLGEPVPFGDIFSLNETSPSIVTFNIRIADQNLDDTLEVHARIKTAGQPSAIKVLDVARTGMLQRSIGITVDTLDGGGAEAGSGGGLEPGGGTFLLPRAVSGGVCVRLQLAVSRQFVAFDNTTQFDLEWDKPMEEGDVAATSWWIWDRRVVFDPATCPGPGE